MTTTPLDKALFGESKDRIDPRDQFQIGDPVVHVPTGVRTNIEGYVWAETVGGSPRILAYVLECGVSVSKSELERDVAQLGTWQ